VGGGGAGGGITPRGVGLDICDCCGFLWCCVWLGGCVWGAAFSGGLVRWPFSLWLPAHGPADDIVAVVCGSFGDVVAWGCVLLMLRGHAFSLALTWLGGCRGVSCSYPPFSSSVFGICACVSSAWSSLVEFGCCEGCSSLLCRTRTVADMGHVRVRFFDSVHSR